MLSCLVFTPRNSYCAMGSTSVKWTRPSPSAPHKHIYEKHNHKTAKLEIEAKQPVIDTQRHTNEYSCSVFSICDESLRSLSS